MRYVILVPLWLGFLAVAAVAGPWPADTNVVTVTCELAYYAGDSNGIAWQPIPPTSDAKKLAKVGGAVLKIIEPKMFSGQLVAFHFDGPPSPQNTRYYEPGMLYQGQIRTDQIGKPGFMCDPVLTEIKLMQPLPRMSSSELRRLLKDRHWNEKYVAAIRDQFGDKEFFRTLYGFLTETNQAETLFADQQQAARFLLNYQPPCEVSLATAIGGTFSSCDEFVSEWPLYLSRCFGREDVLKELKALEKNGKLAGRDTEKIETWRFWLSGDNKAVESRSRK